MKSRFNKGRLIVYSDCESLPRNNDLSLFRLLLLAPRFSMGAVAIFDLFTMSFIPPVEETYDVAVKEGLPLTLTSLSNIMTLHLNSVRNQSIEINRSSIQK